MSQPDPLHDISARLAKAKDWHHLPDAIQEIVEDGHYLLARLAKAEAVCKTADKYNQIAGPWKRIADALVAWRALRNGKNG